MEFVITPYTRVFAKNAFTAHRTTNPIFRMERVEIEPAFSGGRIAPIVQR